jgi:hypothetical protein
MRNILFTLLRAVAVPPLLSQGSPDGMPVARCHWSRRWLRVFQCGTWAGAIEQWPMGRRFRRSIQLSTDRSALAYPA